VENLTERQAQLLEWLRSEACVTIEAIQERFGISVASAYRDAQALVKTGLALKINGGVKLFPSVNSPSAPSGKCYFCGNTINIRTMFIIQMQDGSQRNACCPHCGMMALEQPGVYSAVAYDFLYGRLVNIRQAAFLLESLVDLCCKPSVLCFSSFENARCFQIGFGGKVCSLEQAIASLKQLMVLNFIDLGEENK
jgi:DeoR family transcriptional regulator, copper-sensing transcriptional repressor